MTLSRSPTSFGFDVVALAYHPGPALPRAAIDMLLSGGLSE